MKSGKFLIIIAFMAVVFTLPMLYANKKVNKTNYRNETVYKQNIKK